MCRIWYHIDCMGFSEDVWQALSESRLMWICRKCGFSNYTDCLFHDFGIPEDVNTFQAVSNDGDSNNAVELMEEVSTGQQNVAMQETVSTKLKSRKRPMKMKTMK